MRCLSHEVDESKSQGIGGKAQAVNHDSVA